MKGFVIDFMKIFKRTPKAPKEPELHDVGKMECVVRFKNGDEHQFRVCGNGFNGYHGAWITKPNERLDHWLKEGTKQGVIEFPDMDREVNMDRIEWIKRGDVVEYKIQLDDL
jgi:hypothetical protein